MPFKRIDIHAHVHFKGFDSDREEVMRRALDAGTAVINVGTDLESSRQAVALADKYPSGVYAIIGQHPVDTDASFDPAPYEELAKHPKVVGIGECGLDYFHIDDSNETLVQAQKKTFIAQIELANKVGKPLMLHVRNSKAGRNAYAEAIEMLKASAKVKGNSHFFAGTVEDAKAFNDMGFTVSFTGAATFARQYEELIKSVPLDMMHAETDCPFVAPIPHRGERNEPSFVSLVYEKIARVKGLPVEEVERQLVKNAERMFGISLL